jgi:hypothetical protein
LSVLLTLHILYDAAIALVLTALLATAEYILQNKNAADANKVQHEVIQEAAEREKVEVKAGKQLERVQMQLAEFVNPVSQLVQSFTRAFETAVPRCGLEDYAATYRFEYYSPPTQPHVDAFNSGNPAMIKAISTKPFAYTLAPEDVARLDENPGKRARWIELCTCSLMPPLRELVPILHTKVRIIILILSPVNGHHESLPIVQHHLAELGKPGELDAMMPGLGRSWGELIANQGHIMTNTIAYAAEWEAVAARWASEDHAQLQPATPCWVMPLLFINVLLKQKVAKKELEL